MPFFTRDQFELLSKWGGEPYDRNNNEHKEVLGNLTEVCKLIKKWAIELVKERFPDGKIDRVNMNPMTPKQNPTFRDYYWARMYPSQNPLKNLVYSVTISSDKRVIIAIDTYEDGKIKGLRDQYERIREKYKITTELELEEVLKFGSMEELVKWSVTSIEKFSLTYDQVAEKLGLENNSGKNVASTKPDLSNSNLGEILPSKNVILFGPPGTGKTFELKRTYFPRFTETSLKTKEQYADELVYDLTWWKVIAVAILDIGKSEVSVPEIIRHPLFEAKARKQSSNFLEATAWASLQTHTLESCSSVKYRKRTSPQIYNKSQEGLWSLDREAFTQEFPKLTRILESFKAFKPEDQEVKRYRFVTFHQSFSYEDFVEGIKPKVLYDEETDFCLEGGEEADGSIAYAIKPGVFRELAECALKDQSHEYALIIDEINRGNVANIFGELITLIEDDKRVSGEASLDRSLWTVTLPYSRRKFAVPSNLYIIGTMNTADRSIEALDTALRRRFSFKPFYPNPELLKKCQPDGFNVDFVKLLKTINERIVLLLDRDHTIGHSYLMKINDSSDHLRSLRKAFANSIIPLLQEYFYGDPGRIGMVLGSKFVRKCPTGSKMADGYWGDNEAEDKDIFEITPEGEWSIEAFQSIYE